MGITARVRVFVAVLVIAAAACIAYAVTLLSPVSSSELVLLLLFALIAFFAEIYATWIPSFRMELSSSIAICSIRAR